MRPDERDRETREDGASAAGCLAVSAVLSAFELQHLHLSLSWGGVLAAAGVFLLTAFLVGVIGAVSAAICRHFLTVPHPRRGGRILFWGVYAALLFVLCLLLTGYLS